MIPGRIYRKNLNESLEQFSERMNADFPKCLYPPVTLRYLWRMQGLSLIEYGRPDAFDHDGFIADEIFDSTYEGSCRILPDFSVFISAEQMERARKELRNTAWVEN